MEELLKEINKSLEAMKRGTKQRWWTKDGWKEDYFRPERGLGTKAYTIRRIEILQDRLKELKKDIKDGKYDYSSSNKN